ncbi:MAG: hypothetical protein IPL61_29870 [Myxococcales bacterium]|nr:hypothetical protein [Myxococcales bacterium]
MTSGRIWFPGNPWPDGHAIARFVWSGRLDDRGLWFDLHLESAAYDAADRAAGGDDDDDDGDWRARNVWTNYHRCTLSSTKWRSDGGFLVGTAAAPFDPGQLSGGEFRVDPLPTGRAMVEDLDGDDDDDRPFNVYLLGHDTAADHRLRFQPGPRGAQLSWTGRLALTYAGASEFRHTFSAEVSGARFTGFEITPGLPPDVARDLLAVCTTAPTRFRRIGARFVPTRLG